MMTNYHNPQMIFVIFSLFFVLVLMRLPSESAELKGTVIAIHGGNIIIKVKLSGTIQPAIGDQISIFELPKEDGMTI